VSGVGSLSIGEQSFDRLDDFAVGDGTYEQSPESGEYSPIGYEDAMPAAFF
jgi:hypothetical protein